MRIDSAVPRMVRKRMSFEAAKTYMKRKAIVTKQILNAEVYATALYDAGLLEDGAYTPLIEWIFAGGMKR